MPHLAQGFRLDLADALARDAELPAHFLESAAVTVDQSKTLFEAVETAGDFLSQTVHRAEATVLMGEIHHGDF